MGRLEGKVAVITGAANGIGRAAAELFAANGAFLVLVDRDEAVLTALGWAPLRSAPICRRRSLPNGTWRKRCTVSAGWTWRC